MLTDDADRSRPASPPVSPDHARRRLVAAGVGLITVAGCRALSDPRDPADPSNQAAPAGSTARGAAATDRSPLPMPAEPAVAVEPGTAPAPATLTPTPPTAPTAAPTPVAATPFALGVASGDPDTTGFVIWTRWLDAEAQAAGRDVVLAWEVADDESFRRIRARGRVKAQARLAHSAHVAVEGLAPGRWYCYRFHALAPARAATSPVGRTRTAAGPGDAGPLQLAFASCQQYEQGYYGAYRAMQADAPDAVIFLGDYIYESTWGRDHVRHHGSPEPRSLDEYRARYALYKADPDLQAMHAAAPWVVTWDDHEVENDYAGGQSQTLDPAMPARRAAAYQAWAEHQPARAMVALAARIAAGATVDWAGLRIHRRLRLGPLVDLYVLDDRQYRAAQVCPRPGRGGGRVVRLDECPALREPGRSLLGAQQEGWLDAQFRRAGGGWNLLAQQTLFSRAARHPGLPEESYSTDTWDGYPAARQRLIDSLVAARVGNPLLIGGDVHANWVCDVKADFNRPESLTVASEFCGTSITSQGGDPARHARAQAELPWVHLADSRLRGYGLLRLDAREAVCTLRVVDDVRRTTPTMSTAARFRVAAGRPGPQRI